MSARDDYIYLAEMAAHPGPHPETVKALDEIDRLRRWKAEALEVLSHWDAVVERFDLSSHLGEFTADGVLQEIELLQRDRQHKQLLRTELAKHGWGDFHYGEQPQDPNIVRLLEETK